MYTSDFNNKGLSRKVILQYIGLYVALTIAGASIAYKFWWFDPLQAQGLNRYTLPLFGAAGLAWIGIQFLTSMFAIQRFFRGNVTKFIGIIQLNYNLVEPLKGTAKYRQINLFIPLVSFPLLFVSIAIFVFSISAYERNEFRDYGVVTRVPITDVNYDIKKKEYAHIIYRHAGKTFEHDLPVQNHHLNDTVEIVFSSRNPDIVDYLTNTRE